MKIGVLGTGAVGTTLATAPRNDNGGARGMLRSSPEPFPSRCHPEPFGFAQGRLRERSVRSGAPGSSSLRSSE